MPYPTANLGFTGHIYNHLILPLLSWEQLLVHGLHTSTTSYLHSVYGHVRVCPCIIVVVLVVRFGNSLDAKTTPMNFV